MTAFSFRMERPCGNRRRQAHEQGPAACGVFGGRGDGALGNRNLELGNLRWIWGSGACWLGDLEIGNWGIGARGLGGLGAGGLGLGGGAACPCGARCAPPRDEVWVCCSLTAAYHPVAGAHFARKRRLGRPCVRCLALPGKGRCRCAYSTLFAPAGQKRCRGARRITAGHGKEFFGETVYPSGNFPGAPGNGKRSRRTFPSGGEMYAVSRAERALLPAKSSTSSYRRKRGTLQDAPHPPPSRGENGGLCPHPLKGFIP